MKKVTITTVDIATFLSWVILEKIDLNPTAQRYFVAPIEHFDDLVDTLKKGYPIPSITVVQDESNKFHVIDGRQRLTSILIFMLGDNILKTKAIGDDQITVQNIKSVLEEAKEEKIMFFDKLPQNEQHSILNYILPISIYSLDKNENFQVMQFVLFERLNRNINEISAQSVFFSSIISATDDKNIPSKIAAIKHEIVQLSIDLGYSPSKKNDFSIVKDIRAMSLLLSKEKVYSNDKKVAKIRFDSDLKAIENDFLEDTNQISKSSKAQSVFQKLEGEVMKIKEWINANREMLKDGVFNETTRKAFINLVLNDKGAELLSFVSTNGGEIKLFLSEKYKDAKTQGLFNKVGISTPQKIYRFLDCILGNEINMGDFDKMEQNLVSELQNEVESTVSEVQN